MSAVSWTRGRISNMNHRPRKPPKLKAGGLGLLLPRPVLQGPSVAWAVCLRCSGDLETRLFFCFSFCLSPCPESLMFLLTTNIPTKISKEPKRLGPCVGAGHLSPLTTLEDQVWVVRPTTKATEAFGASPGHSRGWFLSSQGSLVGSGASGGTTEVRIGEGVQRTDLPPLPQQPPGSVYCGEHLAPASPAPRTLPWPGSGWAPP